MVKRELGIKSQRRPRMVRILEKKGLGRLPTVVVSTAEVSTRVGEGEGSLTLGSRV